ncbi:MAG: bifunctional hydroxymethylpyrimidine kinase/phosphomethylpyrimidine kinase [Halobacteriales archaeon]
MTEPRRAAPAEVPVALTVAGSDSGGGAGIQADLKTMEAMGAFGTSAITSVTAQNTRGVESTHILPVEEVRAQIEAVRSDFDVRAVKTGMLAVEPIVDLAAEMAGEIDAPVVVDPVMVAASGDRLLEPEAESAYEDLIAEAAVVTPNADEAEVLTGIAIEDEERAREAGDELVEMGARAALVKGGHVPGDTVRDVLVTAGGTELFEHPRIDTDATHGSGCTLSSAIAASLAEGDDLVASVEAGVSFMERAVRYHLDVGGGPGSVHHLAAIRERADRTDAVEGVESVVEFLIEREARELVPEVGLNVVGATPYAESLGETAAVEGRITKTLSGVRPNRGVRTGASSHVARFLLSAREGDPGLRFAANVRFAPEIEAALDALDGDAVEIDRTAEPSPDEEGSTMGWAARRAFEAADGRPAAVYDRGAVGKEAMTRVLAPDAGTLIGRLRTTLDELRS